ISPKLDVIAELKNAGMDSISVSLNAESEEKYNKLCRPAHKNAYRAILDFVRGAKEAGISTRVTVVQIPEIDLEKCREVSEELGSEFHIRTLSEAASKEIREN
ncbi:MAG: hypothetical protein QG610_1059, partial [Euryarchaeota archaeon]|nr:hypothetical protein [Euryarchaeota archaeon]